jgi:hypothetical protein
MKYRDYIYQRTPPIDSKNIYLVFMSQLGGLNLS